MTAPAFAPEPDDTSGSGAARHTGPSGQPTGSLALPTVRNRLSMTRRAPVSPEPRAPERAWLGLAADMITVVGARPGLTFDQLPEAVTAAREACAKTWFKIGLTRRGLGDASGMTAVYFWRCLTPGYNFAGPRLEQDIEELDDRRLRPLAAATKPLGPRLGLVHEDGLTAGLLLDRLHYTHFGSHLRRQWMAEQVAADLRVGAALPGAKFQGVRVLSNRAMASSLHVLPDGSDHRLGGCRLCIPAGVA